MRRQRVSTGVSVIMAAALLAGCAHPVVSAKVMRPAEVNVSNYQNVAVADFDGPQGKDISRWIEQALIKVRHEDGKPYFNLVARDQLYKVMKEQGLQLTGAIDPAQAKQVGKVLGVDAIITGHVSTYRAQDAHGNERRNQSYQCGTKTCFREVMVSCRQREAYVLFSVNFINVQTGAIETSDSPEAKLLASQCDGDTEGSFSDALKGGKAEPMQSSDVMLKKAADQAVEKFVAKITPHYEDQAVSLKEHDGDNAVGTPSFLLSAEDRTVNEKLKAGVEYAKSGMWPKAIARWEEAVKQKPECAACLYDLGYGYEMTGAFQKALPLYEKAASLRPTDAVYRDAEGRIEKRIKDAEAVESQMKTRKVPMQQNGK